MPTVSSFAPFTCSAALSGSILKVKPKADAQPLTTFKKKPLPDLSKQEDAGLQVLFLKVMLPLD
ncbi:hypothetical protein KP509_04G027600 [Ceratopteris richardii]|nr:hypothetical protein KP509_04G027600 [Ceratopteris richardii]